MSNPKTPKVKVPTVVDVVNPPVEDVNDLEDNQDNELSFNEKIVEQVFDTSNIRVKADISKAQLVPLTKLYVFSQYFNSNAASMIADTFLTLTISKDRKGRIEHTEIAKAAMSFNTPNLEEPEQTISERFILGRK